MPAPGALVFTAPDGSAIVSLRTWWNAAVLKVWKPSKPFERGAWFYDLRRTGGTRVEAVSSHAVAKALLGHADVTDPYLRPTLDDVQAAFRAARLLTASSWGTPFRSARTALMNGTVARGGLPRVLSRATQEA